MDTSLALVKYEDGTVVPCSYLDRILKFKDSDMSEEFRCFSFLDGTELFPENIQSFCETIKGQIEEKQYFSTDHLITVKTINGVNFVYVSLDNSVRANINNVSLFQRINNICDVLNLVLTQLTDTSVVFFSESCRPSFVGSDVAKSSHVVHWFELRQIISNTCGLNYLGECANNEDASMMSFGVSAFGTKSCLSRISNVIPRRILNEGFGSGAIGIKLLSGEIVWGVHFPLDFKNKGCDNLAHKACKGIISTMASFQGSVLAMGDMNPIPGEPEKSILSAIPDNMTLVPSKFPTFYGSYFDTVKPADLDLWSLY